MTSIIRADNISTVAGTGTVTVQAGNTLDASAGFTPPAGHVVQVVSQAFTGTLSVSATSFTDTGHSVSITLKTDTPKILVSLLGGGWHDEGNAAATVWQSFQSNESGSYAHLTGINTTYGLSRHSGDGGTWSIGPHAMQWLYTCTGSAGDTITYRVVSKKNGSYGNSQYSAGDRGDPVLTVQEIKA